MLIFLFPQTLKNKQKVVSTTRVRLMSVQQASVSCYFGCAYTVSGLCAFSGCGLISSVFFWTHHCPMSILSFCHFAAQLHTVSEPSSVICESSLHVISPISSRSICSHKREVWGCFVCQCWPAPSGNKTLKIMATGRDIQSIRAMACSAGRWGLLVALM